MGTLNCTSLKTKFKSNQQHSGYIKLKAGAPEEKK